VLIVTPAVGSMPEPRPQQLITGDRALQLLDTASSVALQAAGVKVATVSLKSYQNLVNTLTPEVFVGLDPVTGKLSDDIIPDRLSAAAINGLDVLGPDNKIISTYLPNYLTPGGINDTIASSSTVQFTVDGDGTPVVLGLAPPSSVNQTFTGTVQAGTTVAGTAHGDLITGTLGQIFTMESSLQLFDNQSVTPGPAGNGQTKLYGNVASRLVWQDASGQVFNVGNKRVVTSLPTALNSSLGDEVIIAATGEHRIYKGSTIGWVLASPLVVADITARNALTNLYPGMRVYVNSSNQEHVYKSDLAWHGTQNVFISGGSVQLTQNVNDTNFRTWNQTNIADPGYKYRLFGRVGMEVVQKNPTSRIEVWVNAADFGTGANPRSFDIAYWDSADSYRHFALAPMTNFDLTGAKSVLITWRCTGNYANAYSGNYQSYNDWMVVPV
jgi:hypothetical protein